MRTQRAQYRHSDKTYVERSEELILFVWRLHEHATEHDPLLQVNGFAPVCVSDEEVLVELFVGRRDAEQRESLCARTIIRS